LLAIDFAAAAAAAASPRCVYPFDAALKYGKLALARSFPRQIGTARVTSASVHTREREEITPRRALAKDASPSNIWHNQVHANMPTDRVARVGKGGRGAEGERGEEGRKEGRGNRRAAPGRSVYNGKIPSRVRLLTKIRAQARCSSK